MQVDKPGSGLSKATDALETGADISVVTPSRNMLSYLKCCVASVRDQQDVTVEHVIQDARSTDGTADWLAQQHGLQWKSESDSGMYDAINRGLARSTGEIVGYLNCDEQYLPGTLAFVRRFFDEHSVDILFGSALLVDPEGALVAFRKSYPARWSFIATSHLYDLSCAMFFRRSVIADGSAFDSNYRSVGDKEFIVRKLREGFTSMHTSRFLSAFTMTGSNLGSGEAPLEESCRFKESLPRFLSSLRLPLLALQYTTKAISGAYWTSMPIRYSIYTRDHLQSRKDFESHVGSPKWPAG
jgi:glycosyltransferase involved in cell wall biosynthesis